MPEQQRGGYWDRINPDAPGFDYRQWPFFALTRLVGLYHQRLETALKPLAIDVPRYRVLMLLSHWPQATVSTIADAAVVKLSTMAKVIQRMAAQGLVQTGVSPDDARAVSVAITDLGREKVALVRARVSLLFVQAFHGMTEAEVQTMTDLVARIDANIR